MAEREGNAAAAAAGAGHWEAPNGVIVLPAGSAAPRQPQQERQYQQRKREMEREQQDHPGATESGVFGLDLTQPPEKVFYKTRLCEKFEAGKCAYEDGCTFAHGFEELRPPLPVPTSLIRRRSPLRPPPPPSPGAGAADGPQGGGYYHRVCFEFRDTGACHRGDRCAFVHASVAELPFSGGPRSVEHALRNASPYAKAAYCSSGSAAAAHRNSSSTSSYAPSSTRGFPSVPANAAGGEGRRKVTRLELLSRKKMSGIYGDWPEQD